MSESFSLECTRSDLLLALQAADAVVPSTSTKQVLTCVHLLVDDEQLIISATDVQVGLRCVLRNVDIKQSGQVLITAKQILSILKESSSPAVRLYGEDNDESSQLHIELADGSYKIPVLKGLEFPSIEGFPNQEHVTISASVLEDCMRRSAFAVDKDRSSAVLSGVYCSIAEGELIMCATDGKVLAEAVYHNETLHAQNSITVVIPAQTIQHYQRLLGAMDDGEVALAVRGQLLCMRAVIGADQNAAVQVELISRLVEGTFPSYRNAIPSNSEGAVTFNASQLQSAVKRTVLMTSQNNRGIIFSIEENKSVLQNFKQSDGTATIPLECTYSGIAVKIALNANYLLDVLRAYRSDSVTMELNGSGRGLIIREEDTTYLIMPITLPNS